MNAEHQDSIPTRVMALDALRGFDMVWIVGGDWLIRSLTKMHDASWTRALSAQMEHETWEGFSFYDLIFPLFVFMVGISIVYSIPRMIETRGLGAALCRIVRRSVILFALGILYMGGVAHGFKGVYLAGVLHRIAVAYFFTGLIFCFCRLRSMVAICVLLLVGYWALLAFVPVPGIGHASYEQGKNLAYYLDQRFLPGQKFEGTLLSTLAAVANCLLGVFAGLFIKNNHIAETTKPRVLIGAGLVSVALGFLWGHYFPIIKLLWTSSYVLVACGYSAILLGVFFQIIEIWQCRKWAQPFVWIGMNAITMYLVSAVVGFRKLSDRLTGGDIRNHLGGSADFAQSAVALALMFWLAHFLYRRKIFLRL